MVTAHRNKSPTIQIIMKTRIASVFILAAALSTSAFVPLSAASKSNLPTGYSVGVINLSASSGNEQIARGASQTAVRRFMGSPMRELSADVWAYRGFHANLDRANEEGCGTLIVTFTHGRVSDLKLVNQTAVGIIAANSNPKAMERYASVK
jgi:hypothetical protein